MIFRENPSSIAMNANLSSATEIRKLPPGNLRELANILEINESWKNLMAIIPKTLEKDSFECNVTRNNPCKYHSEHFKLLEHACLTMNKMCTEILFSEWGTSGKIRPALGHLLYLLTKAELFRAADYVAQNLLSQALPKRPSEGPAATVRFNLPEENKRKIEQELEAQNYHSSVISMLDQRPPDVNVNMNQSSTERSIPKIVISEPQSEFAIPLVLQSTRPIIRRQNASVEEDVVNCSAVTDSNSVSESNSDTSNSENLPNLSAFNIKSNTSAEMEPSGNTPAISMLLRDETEGLTPSSGNVPRLSMIGFDGSGEQTTPQTNENTVSGSNMPHFSALLSDKGSSSSSSQFIPIIDLSSNSLSSRNSSQNSDSRRKCSSPLPNLNLVTPLPHFSYPDVEAATNNFHETPHQNCRQLENPLSETNGRFLGSGAFGQVFLGLGLVAKPVAVKKLFLNNVEAVDINDPVTKQFKNEVEVLSKYKHDNLLSLVGYSCDGPTYCLIYEFLPGGALKDRLQNKEEKLIWTDRLYIALGTARAVNYLHTAYTTPLIHRDIKTANILLDCSNKPKLCDFGLIKLISNQNTNTSTSAFGTSAYMAREAFRGDVSVKLDTYSFGVVLLELITGLPPLDESREGCDIVTHVQEECDDGIGPLIDLKAGSWLAKDVNVAEDVYKLSLKCLEDNKRKRPTMDIVIDELERIIKNCS